jgi:NAD+ synthase (glutamine-hydrolysing)
MKTTKEYIARLREKTGLNNYQIAKQYNINQSNFNKYSAGNAQLSVNHAFLVANLLNISPLDVLVNTRIEKAKISGNKNELEFWSKQQETKKDDTNQDKVIISQFNPTVGDINSNTEKIIKIIQKHNDASLIIFPELAICGYSPEDLLLHNGFIEVIEQHLELIRLATHNTTVIIGTPVKENDALYNSAIVFKGGEKYGVYHKQQLVNHEVFDEKRYFSHGDGTPLLLNLNNKIYSIIICADTWSQDIINYNYNIGVDTLISINASPFSKHKHNLRINTFKSLIQDKLNLIYTNICTSNDGLIFDGGSFVMNKHGEITSQLPFFAEISYDLSNNVLIPYNEIENNYKVLVFAIREYFIKSACFDHILIALSGGIDSAFTLALAVDAIGKDKVKAVMMPYIYTTNASLVDARGQIRLLGVAYKEIDISPIVAAFNTQGVANSGIALENIQARIRGSIIMSKANESNALVLTTSNKSESSVGYATLYGDMAGGFAPIKDVYKTDIYKLANYRNSLSPAIPENIINKAPSAELSHNQFDTNTLPPYEILDKILELFVDKLYSIDEICDQGFDKNLVQKIIKMIVSSEYKRYQSAIGTKFSDNAFDKERRYPIINKFEF